MKLLVIALLFVGCGKSENKKENINPIVEPQEQKDVEGRDDFVLVPVNDKRSLPFSTLTAKAEFKTGEHVLENGILISSGEQTGEGVRCQVSAMKDTMAGDTVSLTAVTAGDDFGAGNTGIYLSYISRDQRKVFVDYCVKFGSDEFTVNDLTVGLGEYFEVK